MDKKTKSFLIVGAVLVALGLVIFTVVMSINHWDFTKLSTVQYVTNTHSVNEDFTDISVTTDTANIVFVPSDSGTCQVVCYEAENTLHSVSVEDGCLTVRMQDERKWYEYIGINIGSPKLTVTLPRKAYQSLVVKSDTGKTDIPGDFTFEQIDITGNTGNVECFASATESLKIQVSTGNIRIQNLSAGVLDLRVSTGQVTASQINCIGILSIQTSTGKATLTDVSCLRLASTGNTGNITLENVIVAKDLSIVRSTGHVNLVKCDASELNIKTDTGNITGTLLSDKVFMVHTDTGRVKVPKTATGGRCEVSTDTGNIKFEIVSA